MKPSHQGNNRSRQFKADIVSVTEVHSRFRLCWTDAVCLVALVLTGLVVFHRVLQFDFVGYDDPGYVSHNIHVLRGLNPIDLKWAWTTTLNGNWHPICWWSYQLDSQLYGNDPWGFHFSNLVLHLIGVSLLFMALRRMGVRLGIAFGVSILVCIHPLHVESVAWISERKGILSSVFWFAGMFAYAGYAYRPSRLRMSLVAICLLGGLMVKPMLVTFPFALMLLDVWPLRRLRLGTTTLEADHNATESVSLGSAIREKTLLFVLAISFCFVAVIAQASAGAVNTVQEVSLATRLLNVPSTCVFSLQRLFIPTSLRFNYQPPSDLPTYAFVSCVLLVSLSYLAFRYRHRALPCLIGWIWFLGCLFPLSGIMPLGAQWTADRYTDIPAIGIYVAVVYLMFQLADRSRQTRTYAVICGGIALSILGFVSYQQVNVWRDARTLISESLKRDPRNDVVMSCMAEILIKEERFDEAHAMLRESLGIASGNMSARNNLAFTLIKLNQPSLAIRELQRVIELDPENAQAHLHMANCLRSVDRDQSIALYRKALSLYPNSDEAHNNLGAMLVAEDPALARKHYEKSLQLWPQNPDALSNLGNLVARQGDLPRAIELYQSALKIDSKHAVATKNLSVVLQGHSQMKSKK